MTTFILHGGASSKKSESNNNFFLKVVNSVDKDNVCILCVYFARPEYRWRESFEEDKGIFTSLKTDKRLDLHLASLNNLADQIKKADIIFINGGRKGCLKETLEGLPNIKELIQHKVIVGISAGANMLSTYYYSNVAEDIRVGVGILPVKMFCHYTEKSISDLDKLKHYKEDLPIYNIPEEQFVIIEK
jgi:peptidase E